MDSYLPRYTLFVCFLFSLFYTTKCERVIFNSIEIRDLFNIDPDFYPNSLLWVQSHTTTTTKTFYCAGLTFYGGTDVFAAGYDDTYIGYGTPLAHNIIYYTLTFSFGGTWGPTDGFNLFFIGSTTEVATWQVGATYTTALCSFNDIKIKGKISHNYGTLSFFVQNLLNPTAMFGFRKISIRLANGAAPTASEKLCLSSDSFNAHGLTVASECTCGTGYYDASGLCAPCSAACEECFGSGPGNCYTCNFGYYHNGIECVACTYTCTDCDTCNICSGLDYYMDNQCVPTCNLPFLAVISGDRRLCLSPCKDTEVIYADGTCQPTCVSPYHLVAVYNQQVCSSPCPGGYTVYYNGTCSPYVCPYPLFNTLISGSGYICKYPCNYPSEIYYKNNGTCSSSCNFPYVTRTYGLFTACEPPCVTGSYRYWDGPTGTCQTCPPLLQPRAFSGVWLCDPPQCGKVLCSACGVGNTCNAYYYCNTTYGAFCMPYYRYALQAREVKPMTNGVRLYVQVVPVAGIQASEDILNYQIYGLQLGVDYTVTVNKISLGVYQLDIMILQSIGQTSPVAGFVYAPNTLDITLDYTLPRLTFISAGVQSSSQSTSKGSQIAFLVFLVSIVGLIFSGGLSSVWTAMPESQYSYYLLYLNVDFLAQTQEYFESLSNYDILLSGNSNNDDLDLSYQDVLPRQFYFKNYTPDFIGNTDQLFLQALITLSLLGISTLILKYVRFSGRGILVMKGIGYIRRSLKWNLLIRQTLTYSLPVCISSFIQIYSIMFGYTVYLPSVILAAATLIAFALFFRYMLSLINNIPKSKYEINTYSQNYGTLWEDLDVSLFSRYYYWLVGLRGCLLAYVTVFFSLYPYVQIITLTVYQCLIVGLFAGKFKLRKVFIEEALNTVTFIVELCLLMVKILIFVFLTMESWAGDNALIMVGWLIIIPAAVAQFVQIFYSIQSQFDIEKLWRAYELIKAKITGKRQKKIRRRMRKITKGVKVIELDKA